MSVTLQFFNDAGLTTPLTALSVTQASDGSSDPVDRLVYLGSNTPGVLFLTEVNPEVDFIHVYVNDTTPGSGVEAAHVTLALSAEDLDTRTPGAALDTEISNLMSGWNYAVPIYVRIHTPALVPGSYVDVSLATSSVVELPQ